MFLIIFYISFVIENIISTCSLRSVNARPVIKIIDGDEEDVGLLLRLFGGVRCQAKQQNGQNLCRGSFHLNSLRDHSLEQVMCNLLYALVRALLSHPVP